MTDFETVYRAYFGDVYRYLCRLTGNAHIAEEITSETFFKAMKAYPRFRGHCDVRVWLCQIAKIRIEAWSSLWGEWFRHDSYVFDIPSDDYRNTLVYYSQCNGEEDILLYGEPDGSFAGVITLPRLALGYYLIIAGIILAAGSVLWFCLRRKFAGFAACLRRILSLPACYIIAHIAVSGFRTVSYAIPRDFALIVSLHCCCTAPCC